MDTGYWNQYESMTPDQILETLIWEEIAAEQNRADGELGSVSGMKRWLIASAAMALAVALVIANPVLVVLCGIILLCWLPGYLKASQAQRLMKIAKNKPDMSLRDIVKADSFLVGQEKRFANSWITRAGIVILGALLGIVGTDTSGEAPGSYDATTYRMHESGYYELVRYVPRANETEVVLPDTYEGVSVAYIGEHAFSDLDQVTVIHLPDSIREIGSYAFKDCDKLTMVNFGRNVEAIGGESFMNCVSLTRFTAPPKLTAIRGNTFENCTALVQVNLHDGITAIHAAAFKGCTSLQSITLPAKITEIRANTFENCSSLAAIRIPEGVTRIAAHAFRGCGKLESVSVPATVTEIGSSAFRSCRSLKTIAIPSGASVESNTFKESPTVVSYLPSR